jgi:hypothetical protein
MKRWGFRLAESVLARGAAGVVAMGLAAVLAGGGVLAPAALAQSAPAAAGDEIRVAALAELKVLEGRELQFANEMPAEKYTWNPGLMLTPPAPNPQADPYGRTVADLFLHIANLNFTHAAQLGAPPAEGFNPKDYETSTTDKTKVIGELAKSFTYAEGWLSKMTAADMTKHYKIGKDDMTGNAALFAWIVDLNDYTGQTIAYGRINGIIGTGPTGFHMRKAGQ